MKKCWSEMHQFELADPVHIFSGLKKHVSQGLGVPAKNNFGNQFIAKLASVVNSSFVSYRW